MIFNNETITSRNNSFIKWVANLSEKKGRNEAESFIAEGVKLSAEAFDAGLPVTHVILCENKKDLFYNKIDEYKDDEKFKDTKVITVSEGVFEKISTEKAPQGVITVIKYLDFFSNMNIIYKEEFFISPEERTIILCSVRDPSNLGSVIRSAVAFGTDRIVLTEDCADIYSPKTVRSAMGSIFRVKVTTVKDLPAFISAARSNGRRVFAAELNEKARAVTEIDLLSTDMFIIGNEGHGIPAEISSVCTDSVFLPISKKTESLNASVAAAVFMWEQSKNKR